MSVVTESATLPMSTGSSSRFARFSAAMSSALAALRQAQAAIHPTSFRRNTIGRNTTEPRRSASSRCLRASLAPARKDASEKSTNDDTACRFIQIEIYLLYDQSFKPSISKLLRLDLDPLFSRSPPCRHP